MLSPVKLHYPGDLNPTEPPQTNTQYLPSQTSTQNPPQHTTTPNIPAHTNIATPALNPRFSTIEQENPGTSNCDDGTKRLDNSWEQAENGTGNIPVAIVGTVPRAESGTTSVPDHTLDQDNLPGDASLDDTFEEQHIL